MTTTPFEERYGFKRGEIALGNWRQRPYNIWSFQNVSEMVTSAPVALQVAEETPLSFGALLGEEIAIGGARETVAAFLERSGTDGLVVMKSGRFIGDYAAPTMDPRRPHLVFSVSKSLTAIVAGVLQHERLLDPDAPVAHYIPEVVGSAYGDATVRHVLDMRVSLEFEENYLDTTGWYARYRRSTMWNPGFDGETLLRFLTSLRKGSGQHGGPFRYRSPNSDLLGVIVERASGRRFAELLREKVLAPIGARGHCFVTVDAEGTARTAGGVSIAMRDLARVGEMMRNGGMAGSRAVVSEPWVRDTIGGGDKAAWAAGDFPYLFAEGSYRNKWYQTGYASGAFCAIGIHGQWLYVDPSREVVIVKASSQAEPEDNPLNLQCLEFFEALAAIV